MAVALYTEDELRGIIRKLELQYASCIASTGFADRNVTYTADLLGRIAYFKGLLAELATEAPRARQSLMVGRKGFNIGPFR